MQRVDTTTAVASQPSLNPDGTPGFFSQGNPGTGALATVPGQDWFNNVQEELMSVVAADPGLTPSKHVNNQVKTAISYLISTAISALGLGTAAQKATSFFLQVANNGSDIANTGTFRTNLGLGQAAVKAVSDNSQSKVASVSGSFTTGHLIVAGDTAGTSVDGGPVPSGYTPPAATVETGTFTPSATPGKTYYITNAATVNLNPSGLSTGWYADFSNLYSSGAVVFQPTSGLLDGCSNRYSWYRTFVRIMWDGTNFNTIAGAYRFDSGDITSIANSGVYSFTHNMLLFPYFRVWLTCTDPGGDAGYTQNQRIDLSAAYASPGLTGGNPIGGAQVEFTATAVSLLIGTHGIAVLNGSSNAEEQLLTLSKWKARIVGWSE